MLPLPVLEQCAREMTDYNGSGMSVMEMSHRSPVYDAIIKEAEKDLRELMNIPDNYKVLFMQGGASTQFAAVPLNLMKTSPGPADHMLPDHPVEIPAELPEPLSAHAHHDFRRREGIPRLKLPGEIIRVDPHDDAGGIRLVLLGLKEELSAV